MAPNQQCDACGCLPATHTLTSDTSKYCVEGFCGHYCESCYKGMEAAFKANLKRVLEESQHQPIRPLLLSPLSTRSTRKVTIYRDDSTSQVVYDNVKAWFWTAGNTVLVVSQYIGDGPEHRYIHWPRERVCWFKDDPSQEITTP